MPDVERAANDAMVLGDLRPDQVRVRFPPSPTGNLHVGNVRSALFNWAFARHYGGTFILRIEDTDVGRNLPEPTPGCSTHSPGSASSGTRSIKGGPYGPYIQSERTAIYRDVVAQLLAAGLAYRCYCTREEIEARQATRPTRAPSGYDGTAVTWTRNGCVQRRPCPRRRSSGCWFPTRRSTSTIWFAVRSASLPLTCLITSWYGRMASRCTPWSIRWTTR